MSVSIPRRTALAGLAAAALAAGVASPAAASAAPVPTLDIAYDAVGTTHVAKPNSDVALGPSVFTTKLASDGTFTGRLPLTPQPTTFAVLGLIPISATVTFIPVGRITGTLSGGTKPVVTTEVRYTVRLSNITAAGLPTFAGDTCQTVRPVRIQLATPKGQTFNIFSGGTVTGKFALGPFANCGLTTALVNQLVPGTGNTASITLSNGRRV